MRKDLVVIWGSFIAAPVIYIGISMFIAPTMSPQGAIVMPLSIGFGCMATIFAMVSIVMRMRMVIEPLQNKTIRSDTAEGEKLIQTKLIVIWAMVEAIAIFGLVLAILSANYLYSLPFCVVSFLLLFFHHPFLFRSK